MFKIPAKDIIDGMRYILLSRRQFISASIGGAMAMKNVLIVNFGNTEMNRKRSGDAGEL